MRWWMIVALVLAMPSITRMAFAEGSRTFMCMYALEEATVENINLATAEDASGRDVILYSALAVDVAFSHNVLEGSLSASDLSGLPGRYEEIRRDWTGVEAFNATGYGMYNCRELADTVAATKMSQEELGDAYRRAAALVMRLVSRSSGVGTEGRLRQE